MRKRLLAFIIVMLLCLPVYADTDPGIPAHGHVYTEKCTPATCTEMGYFTYTCSCGETFKGNFTSATGHYFVDGKCYYCGVAEKLPDRISFSDIADLVPDFRESINWAVQKEITAGYHDGTFRPNADCTRGHVVTFLWRAAGSPEPRSPADRFRDVSKYSPFFKAILWAAENGITAGYPDGTFRPNDVCTRAHVVTFLWRCKDAPAASGEVNFTDLDGLNAEFTAAIKWAASAGVTSGYPDGTFRPNAVCTRAHVVTFLYRAEV